MHACTLPALCAALAVAAPLAAQHPETLSLTVEGRTVASGRAVLVGGSDRVRIKSVPAPPATPASTARAEGFQLLEQSTGTSITWHVTNGLLTGVTPGEVHWHPPGVPPGEPAPLHVRHSVASRDSAGEREADIQEARITLLPSVPFKRDGDGMLAGTMVGIYPSEFDPKAPSVVTRNPELYRPPGEFWRVDDSTRRLLVTGRQTLGFFAPPVFEDEGPRYIPLDRRLFDLWSALEAEFENAGELSSTLRVIRGYVSPQERLRLERLGVRLATYTRYQYGDALAIIVDRDADFRMDDLNRDGAIDAADSEVLAERVQAALRAADLRGGVGIASAFEGPNHVGTPYVHVDLRGWNETWRE